MLKLYGTHALGSYSPYSCRRKPIANRLLLTAIAVP